MKNFLKSFSIFSLLFFCIQVVNAATGKVSGYVFDKSTNKPIPDANVIIENTNFGAASRDGGFYFIEKVPPGQYDIVVKVIGYEMETKKDVMITETTVVNFSLTPVAIEFDPIIITATLSDHLLSHVSVASEVLTQPRLRERAGSTVGEAMVSVGGIYFNSYDGIAGTHIPSIRGSNTDQVVVLLDGLRLNIAQGGGVDLNLIPVSVIEKIEVVRGGHSTLIGSDAIGGAIQLFSKESVGLKGFSYGINTTIGSFGTKSLNLSGSHKIGLLSYFVNYNRIQTDGDFTYKTPDTAEKQIRENNDYQGDNLFVKTNFDFNPNNKIDLLFHNLIGKKGNAGSVNISPWTGQPLLTPNARAVMTRRLSSVKSENQITYRLRFEGQIYFQTFDLHYTNPDDFPPTDDTHENSAIGLNLQGQFNFTPYITLIGGAEIRQDRLESTKFEVDDRHTQSLYLQSEIRLPFSFFGLKTQLISIPAMRWDNYSDVDAQISPKFGFLLSTGEDVRFGLKGNVGNSYRVPTFDDLYWPEDAWVKGNPDLKPETSMNSDVGFVFNHQSSFFIQAEINYFSCNIEDLISWGADDTGIWTPLNIGKATIRGIETGFKLRLPSNLAYIDIFHTWMKATDETPNSDTKGKRLIYRPNSKLDIHIGSKVKNLSVNLNYRLVSKRYIIADNSRLLSDYNLLNGNISYTLPIAGFVFDAKLQVLNMLDKSIYVYDGYPLPGREVRFSLGVNY